MTLVLIIGIIIGGALVIAVDQYLAWRERLAIERVQLVYWARIAGVEPMKREKNRELRARIVGALAMRPEQHAVGTR